MPEPIIEPNIPNEPEPITPQEPSSEPTPTVPTTPNEPEPTAEPTKEPEDDVKAPEEPELNEPESKEPEGDDDTYDPYDAESVKAFIKRQTAKSTAPVKDQVLETKIQTDLNAVLSQHPEYKDYEDRIRKWVNHPNRKGLIKQGLPVSTVVIEAVAPFLQKIGAKKAKEADANANKTKSFGSTPTPKEPSAPDYSKMSAAEIEKMANQIKSGRYGK